MRFIFSSDFKSGTKICEEVLKSMNNIYILPTEKLSLVLRQDHLSIISLDQFLKDVHPVLSVNVFLEKYFQGSIPLTKKIFSSSGSTGTPKLIPLTFGNIDACFNACHSRFLSHLDYSDIICLHSTSFVIVLPYLFAFLVVRISHQ